MPVEVRCPCYGDTANRKVPGLEGLPHYSLLDITRLIIECSTQRKKQVVESDFLGVREENPLA
jgi:hypothetical protein